MNIKNIKITLIIFFGLLLFSFALFTYAQNNAASDKNIFLDSDQDGLSNVEEKMYGTNPNNPDTDGDGYTDGAEVKSGYDPLKPAPGDKIISSATQTTQPVQTSQKTSDNRASQASQASSNTPVDTNAKADTTKDTAANNSNASTGEKNLTQEFSAKVASLVTGKSQDQQDITLQDLDTMIQETAGSSLTFDDLPAISDKDIKIKKQNYKSLSDADRLAKEKEDSLGYLVAISYILANNSPQKISTTEDLSNLFSDITNKVQSLSSNITDVSYFENLADKFGSSFDELKSIEVPENMKDIHIKGLQLMTYAMTLKNDAKPKSNDPVFNIISLSKVQNFISLGIDFSNEVNSRLKDLGISEIPVNL